MEEAPSTNTAIQPALLDAVCDALSSAIIIYDKNDHLLYANRLGLHYFPVPAAFLSVGTRLRDFLGAVYDHSIRMSLTANGGPLPGREEWIAERIAAHWRERSETQERDKRGRWIRLAKRRLPSGYGICVVTDITDQKKREEQWRADLERVQLTEEILDNLPHPIFVKDRNFNMVAVNKLFCALLGAGAEAILGRPCAEIFDAGLAAKLDTADRHVLETGVPALSVERLTGRDGTERQVIVRSQRVGKPGRYFLVTSMDEVLEPRAADGRGAMAPSLTAEPAPQAKPATGITDERRSPMRSSPIGFSGRKVLLVTADTDFEAKSLKVLTRLGVDSCSVRSETEQQAFLSVAKSVDVTLDLVVVDNQMDLACLELAEQYGIDVVTLDAFQLDTDLAFLVSEHLSDAEGTHLLASDDWEISTVSDGPAPDGASAIEVLVVEDNEINQIVFSQILEGLGRRYRIAATGSEALRLWDELRPPLMLLDVSLPDINGMEVCRTIREQENRTGRQTPIIGVLVPAFDQDRAKCLAAGMNDVILKPLSPDAIETLLDRFMPIEGFGLAP
ncbi:response regulator [Rhizobium sp. CG5]|nr:response regulator [Rhizobium sp. CG5]MCM2472990.1 response regulator [Rhizobium sp. CG5]